MPLTTMISSRNISTIISFPTKGLEANAKA